MSVARVRLNCGQSVCRLSSDSVTALLVQVERHTLTGGPHPAIAGSNVIVKPQTWQFSQRSIVRPHTYSVAAVGSRAAGRAHSIPASPVTSRRDLQLLGIVLYISAQISNNNDTLLSICTVY